MWNVVVAMREPPSGSALDAVTRTLKRYAKRASSWAILSACSRRAAPPEGGCARIMHETIS